MDTEELRGRAQDALASVSLRWRRSLQLRVVASTMLLGTVVVLALGTFLLGRIGDGLVSSRTRAALAEAERGTQDAQAAFDAADRTDPSGLNTLVNDLLPRLASPEPGGPRQVVLLKALGNERGQVVPDISTGDVDRAIVPADLRGQVVAAEGQRYRFVTVRRDGASDSPGIAVGQKVTLPTQGDSELYFVFSLAQEQRTLDLVERTFVGGGVVLVLLVGAVAYVVTRLVVAPVRRAAQVAQRLSSGRLQERMRVRGEDDLALLAASFNAMATSLQSQIRQLEDLSRVQQRFVSDVSHELRTPLTTIRMAGEVIHDARHDLHPAAARSAELLQTQLDRFESLLTDLLEISRFDAGAAVLDLEPVDVREVVSHVLEATTPLAERHGAELRLLAPERECVAEVDRRRLERIVRNLLDNAVEHSEGRPVEVHVGVDDLAVAVLVRDHGVGLKPGESSLVFNRFWRADPARARTTGGTGLGLAISLEDARLHGGWLQAWGEPGEGSSFRVTLPRSPDVTLTASPLPLAPRREPEDPIDVGGPYQRITRADARRVLGGPRG